jgi:uncharacterized membrane protein YjgN (DUF898 family)
MLAYAPVGGRVEAKITFGEIFGHVLLWVFLIIITLGIALFFFPYSFAKFMINRTYLTVGGERAKLQCDLGTGGQLGHIIGWLLLTIITFGIAYPFYVYKVFNVTLNNTRLVY